MIAAALDLLREAVRTLAPLAAVGAASRATDGAHGVSDAQVLHHAEPALEQIESAAKALRALYDVPAPVSSEGGTRNQADS